MEEEISVCEIEDRNCFFEHEYSSILSFLSDPEEAYIRAATLVTSIPYILSHPRILSVDLSSALIVISFLNCHPKY